MDEDDKNMNELKGKVENIIKNSPVQKIPTLSPEEKTIQESPPINVLHTATTPPESPTSSTDNTSGHAQQQQQQHGGWENKKWYMDNKRRKIKTKRDSFY